MRDFTIHGHFFHKVAMQKGACTVFGHPAYCVLSRLSIVYGAYERDILKQTDRQKDRQTETDRKRGHQMSISVKS